MDVQMRVALLLLAGMIVILIGQVGRELVPPDDLREVEVAREMLERGDYVVPYLAGLPLIEKPSGFYAAVAMAYRIAGGPNATAARAVQAAFALASLVAVFLLGRRLFGLEGACLAVAVLALSQRFCRTAHEVLLDNALAAAIAFALFFAWVALDSDMLRKKRLAYAGLAFSIGLSFLFKGFVGPVLFASGFFLYLVVSRRIAEIRHVLRPLPIAAFLAPVLAWVIPFLLHAPSGLVQEFFIASYLGRFLGHPSLVFIHPFGGNVVELAHAGWPNQVGRPIYFYLTEIWTEFAPGSVFLPFAAWKAWKTRKERQDQAGLFFLCMIVASLVLLSVAAGKSPVYFLPAHPALAVLVTWFLMKAWGAETGEKTRYIVKIAMWAVTVFAILAPTGLLIATMMQTGLIPSVWVVAIVLVLAATACIASIARKRLSWTATWAVLLFALGWCLWFTGPMAAAESAKRSIKGPAEESLKVVGTRDILLYHPPDGLPGAVGFFRNRTAQEIVSPRRFVASLTNDPVGVVGLVYWGDKQTIPPELNEAAAAAGSRLEVEGNYRWGGAYLLLISAAGNKK